MSDNLVEFNEEFDYSLVESAKANDKKYVIRGCFSKAGVKNKNGRVYPKKVMKKAIEEIKESVEKGRFIAECEHPQSPKVNIENIAALVTQINMVEDGSVLGEMRILDTPKGKIIKTLIDEGVKLGVSTRGTGALKKKAVVNESGITEQINEVQDGFKLRAIDIVFDPSAGEFGSPEFVAESVDFDSFNDDEGKQSINSIFNMLLR